MARQDQESSDDLDTQGIPDLDAAPGPRGRARGGELSEDEDLDSEGQPDLMGALHQKEITGDAQEGEVPPRNYKQAPDDYFHQDTLDERLREEVPDRIRPDQEEVRLIDDESEDGGELRSELGDEGGYPSAEVAIQGRRTRPCTLSTRLLAPSTRKSTATQAIRSKTSTTATSASALSPELTTCSRPDPRRRRIVSRKRLRGRAAVRR